MCRLFAYAAPRDHAVTSLLSQDEFEEFSALSDLHADGWGMAWLPGTQEEAHVGSTRSVSRANDEPRYSDLASTPMGRAGLVHIRWATPGFPVRVENSHPFRIGEWAFAHNGSISDSDRILDLLSDDTRSLLEADTDSKRFFLLVAQRIAELGDPVEGLQRAVADIRRVCGSGCLNCILLGDDVMIALQSQGETEPPISMLQSSAGEEATLPAGHDETYYHLRYSKRGDSILISSTGITKGQWTPLDDDTMIVADLSADAATILPLRGERDPLVISFDSASALG
jgi:predicted glutamine amidotransferase